MNKYRNKPVTAFHGTNFRSRRERDHALWLESERQAGRIAAWEYEAVYTLCAASPHRHFPSVPVGKHRPDFTVRYPDGRIEIHEVKGGDATKTEAWSLRKRIFEANYPKYKIRVFDGKESMGLGDRV